MFTSFFCSCANHPNAVAISSRVPDYYQGRHYPKLGPSWSIFSEWRKNHDNALYTRRYNSEILANLDPVETFNELGSESILLCYEPYSIDMFCHRRLIALWFEINLHIEVEELIDFDETLY